LDGIVGPENSLFDSASLTTIGYRNPQISKLYVPLHEIQEYEKILDRIIQKQNQLERKK